MPIQRGMHTALNKLCAMLCSLGRWSKSLAYFEWAGKYISQYHTYVAKCDSDSYLNRECGSYPCRSWSFLFDRAPCLPDP